MVLDTSMSRNHIAESGHTLAWQTQYEEGWHEPHWTLLWSLREGQGCSKVRHSEIKDRKLLCGLEQVEEEWSGTFESAQKE